MERLEREVYKMSEGHLERIIRETRGLEKESIEKQIEVYCGYYKVYGTYLLSAYEGGADSDIDTLKVISAFLEKVIVDLCMRKNGYYCDMTYGCPRWEKNSEERNEEYEND